MENYCSLSSSGDWKKKRNNEEYRLQSEFMRWLGYQHPKVFEVTFSIPNEGRRSWNLGSKLKRSGLKKGVPDIFIAYPSGSFHGLFIEFKSKGKKPSDAQDNMLSLLSEQKYQTFVVVADLDKAIDSVNEYLEKQRR